MPIQGSFDTIGNGDMLTVLRQSMRLSGKVSSGLGRAHVFMAQRHYQDQFRPIISMTAWPGTLNVEVEGEILTNYRKLRVSAGIEEGEASSFTALRINGFERDGVSFGGATAFNARIISGDHEEDCAILIPDLTRHEDVVEIICGKFLRESMQLVDGDVVEIQLLN
jgi:CTP-dependent riboflavin kinase